MIKKVNFKSWHRLGFSWCILTVISLLMAVHLNYRSPGFPYSSDSANYIEQARNLANSGSFLVTPYGLSPANNDQIEDKLFPIGFAIVLAAISKLGFDVKDAATAISYWSAILLPWLLYFGFRQALGARNALLLAYLSVISPSVLTNSPMGLTDTFALALSAGAVGLTLNSRSILAFILGGILAGMAYAVRNAQLSLLIAIALYFGYVWITSGTANRRVLCKNAFGLFFGVGIIVVPLFIRNILLFGALNPYQMAPSSIGFIQNLRTYIEVLIKDVSACGECANYIAWSVPGLLSLAFIVSFLFWLLIKYVWCNLKLVSKKAMVISMVYVLVGSCVVIVARTRYEWGALINLRHSLPYTPFLLAILLVPVSSSLTSFSAKWLKLVQLVLVISVAAFHMKYALFSDTFQTKKNNYLSLLNAYETGKKHLCASESNVFLVSNLAYVFRIKCSAPVRHLKRFKNAGSNYNEDLIVAKGYNEGLMKLIVDIQSNSEGRPIHVGLFPDPYSMEGQDFPVSNEDQQKLVDSGWAIIRNDKNGIMIQYTKNK
jgi:hypothetical protein